MPKTYWLSFCKEMLPSVMDGSKTLTSRVMRVQPLGAVKGAALWADGLWRIEHEQVGDHVGIRVRCPYGQPGDVLKVREGYRFDHIPYARGAIWGQYLADDVTFKVKLTEAEWARFEKRKFPSKDTSARFMYNSLCRTQLVNREVRVERLQDLTEADAIAEGVEREGSHWKCYAKNCGCFGQITAWGSFATLWDSINAKRGHTWASNPWVWRVRFERVTE